MENNPGKIRLVMRYLPLHQGADEVVKILEAAHQRARPVRDDDFLEFDLIVTMDSDNERALRAVCPPAYGDRLVLATDFAPELREREIPDPYYVGEEGFEKVLDMLELCMEGLMDELHDRLDERNTIA